MPFDVSEEQNLLTSMLTERDGQISTLTHQLHTTSELLHTTQKELQSKSASRKAQREEHSSTIKKLKEEHSEQRRILAKFESNVKNGGGLRVHEYAALMRSANSNQVESSYVIRLQAQLCRAMHSLGVMESQLALVKENCSSLIKFMKEDLSHMVDDRTRREIELMNGLAKVDNEKRIMAEEMESKIQEKEELLDQVREEYEELGLEYDENEVKRALEVKYLLEQMEKVYIDKTRLEKELLAALLEREEQIGKLRVDTEHLGVKLDGLKMEAEQREAEYNTNIQTPELEEEKEDEGGNNAETRGEDNIDEGGVSAEDGDKVEEEVAEEQAAESNVADEQQPEDNAETVSEVTSQLEAATVDDSGDNTTTEEEKPSGDYNSENTAEEGEAEPSKEGETNEADSEITPVAAGDNELPDSVEEIKEAAAAKEEVEEESSPAGDEETAPEPEEEDMVAKEVQDDMPPAEDEEQVVESNTSKADELVDS